VRHIQEELEVSERRACEVVEQPRATNRYKARQPEKDKALIKRMLELSRKHPRYGYRRITALLKRTGYAVNRKRVQRLWRKEGLKVPMKQRKRMRLGHSGNSCCLRRSEHRNEVWSYDFVMDQTSDGRRLKLLPIVDEYTRESLVIEVARRMEAVDVVGVLAALIAVRGAPGFIRSDNGPEFIAEAVREYLAKIGAETLFIAPGSPWENAYSETFNSRLGDELLKREVFTSLTEAKVLVEQYRRSYNEERPHSALEYRTPAAFAAACVAAGSATLRLPQRTGQQTAETLITAGT
jgi:transposase InsO family protein